MSGVTLSEESGHFDPGCSFNFLWLPLIGAAVTAGFGGPWWVPLSCFAVMLLMGLGALWSLSATGLLVYFTWSTWWMAIPLAVFVAGTFWKLRSNPSKLRDRGLRSLALYSRTSRRRHLRRAFWALRRAVALSTPYDPNHALYKINYVMALLAVHEHKDEPGVLEYAERLSRETLSSLPPGHPHRHACLSGLGTVLQARYKQDGDLALLEESAGFHREALASPHDDDEDVALLTNLGGALLKLAEQDGNPRTLAEGLRICRAAVAATPAGFRYAYSPLNNLNGALMSSYSVNGELAALEEAVQVGRRMVAVLRPGSPLADGTLSSLASTLLLLFERTRQAELLDEAADLARDALVLCPPGHPRRGEMLNALGRVLWVAAEHGDRPDLAGEAVTVLQEAVDHASAHQAGRGYWLDDLCAASVTSFTVHKRPKDLITAVRAGRDALALTPPDDLGRALASFRLGLALETQYDHSGDPAALAGCCRAYAEAAHSASAPVSVRCAAARKATEAYVRAQDHGAALAMAELAVAQIPRIAPRRLGFDDRVHRAASVEGLAAAVAEAAIAAGEPGRAAELLEQTRGIVLGGVFDMREDLTELRSHAPGLARELEDLVNAFEHADTSPPFTTPDHEALSELRTRLDRQWDDLLARVRKCPGLQNFLLPLSIGQLCEQAAEGPVICVVAHREHGNALVLAEDPSEPVAVVNLPLLTRQAVDEQVAALHHAHHSAAAQDDIARRRQAQEEVLRVIEWLWDAVASPVLDTLALTTPPADGQPWPRVWWCPVGPCAFLPLHAAGRHTDRGHDTVMDRVISSYTTTVRALAHSRSPRSGARRKSSVLAVSSPGTPDTAPLPGAVAEARLLRRLLPSATVLYSPDSTAVTTALPHHEITHFACHGIADLRTPTNSRLLLRDHAERPLTVSAVSRLHLDRGELAYLSACSTTHTTARHADEAVSLTAAFQLAGYRSVVGTLWPVNDRAAVTIAEDFYTRLIRPGTASPDPGVAAAALHHALRSQRTRYPDLPLQWASHIHHGP